MPLLSIAPELTLLVSDWLDIESIKNFRLTCKQLAEILSDAVLRELTIHITKDNIQSSLEKLAALANSNHPAARATRELYIRSLSPTYDPAYRGPTYSNINGQWVIMKEPEVSLDIQLAEEQVKVILFTALTSLKAVQFVSWTPYPNDSEWAHLAVEDALKQMADIRHFGVVIDGLKVPLPVTLSSLQSITVDGGQEQDLDNLAKVIAASPQLSSINVKFHLNYNRPLGRYQSLHQLFKYWPAKHGPLQLRDLSLANCLVRLDEITLPHLTHLTYLELINIEDPYFRHPFFVDEFFPEEEESAPMIEKKRYGSSKDDWWKALKEAGVHLEEIIIEDANPSFLEYLSSYSGLKTLHLSARNFLTGEKSDKVAEGFFGKPLQMHCGTLQALRIEAAYEGLWCFNMRNSRAIANCRKLHTISMSVISSQIQNAAEDPMKGSIDIIQHFLDTVITHMPRLEDIHIQAANLESQRWATCGNGSMTHFSRVGSLMAASVNNYLAPVTCRRLPALSVGSINARPAEANQVNDGLGSTRRLRYVVTEPQNGWY